MTETVTYEVWKDSVSGREHIFTTPELEQAVEGAIAMAIHYNAPVMVTQKKSSRYRTVKYKPNGTRDRLW